MSWKDQHKAEAEKVAETLISKTINNHLDVGVERLRAHHFGKKAIHLVIQGLTHQELKTLKDAVDYLKKTESEATE
jgi:hypothetical protein